MNNFEKIIQKGEEEGAEATDIGGDPHTHETEERTFSFSEDEKQEMRKRGMSEEDIEEKREEVLSRINSKDQKAA